MFEPLRLLRVTALVEAVSYLVLLAIAMPLKWWWGMPLMVRIVGMAHGALFLLMIWFLLRARIEKDWPMARLRLIFLASLVPLWPFFLDRRMRVWCQEGDAPRPAS